MTKVVSFLARLGFWPFVILFTFLATILAEMAVTVVSYWMTGSFFDRTLLTAGFIVPIVVGLFMFSLVAYLIRYLVTVQESLKSTKKGLKNSNMLLKEAQKIAHLGFWEFDLEGDKLFWNDEVYQIFGLEPQEFEATFEGFLSYVHPDDRDVLTQEYRRSVEEKRSYHLVHRIIQKNGSVRYVEEYCEHTYNSEGQPVRSVGTVYDITERIADQSKLQRLFDLQKNIIIQTDGKHLKKANRSFLNFFGCKTLEKYTEKYGCICDLLVDDERFFHRGKVPEGENWIEVIESLPKKERIVSLINMHGHPHAFSVSVNRFDDDDFIVSFTDISETIQEQFSLEERVSRDHLTGAYSRDFFEGNIHDLIENAQKRNRSLGLVMMDIDRFKNVNDTFGHDIGDRVLKHLVSTVKYSIRSEDLLIRWGGEEFLLITETESIETLRRMAEHVRQRVENEPFAVVGKVTCSFGITLHIPNESVDQTLKRADIALYKAKENGRNRVV